MSPSTCPTLKEIFQHSKDNHYLPLPWKTSELVPVPKIYLPLAKNDLRPVALTPLIGLFKMFSRWIWGIFNIQIQSDRGHKLMLLIFQNKDKDLLGIYQYGCDPFCVSLLTDRHLKVRSNSILFTFSDKGALTSGHDS